MFFGRNPGSQTVTSMIKTWWRRFLISLLLALTQQELHWDGHYYLWPSIQKYKVRSLKSDQRFHATVQATICALPTQRSSQLKITFNLLDQVQEELSRVIGSRQAQVEDRKSMPFTDAVIHETQRLGNVAPVALPHKTSQDVTFQGHFIKKVRMDEKRNLKGDLSCKMHFCTSSIHEYVSPVCQGTHQVSENTTLSLFLHTQISKNRAATELIQIWNCSDVRNGELRLYGQLSTYQGNGGLGHGHGHCRSKALETL